MHLEQDMPMSGKNDNTLENFDLHKNDNSILKKQDIERDNKDLVGKDMTTRSHARDGLLGQTPQDGLLISELSSLREVKFNKQEFSTGKPGSDIKYHYLGSDNIFY